MKKIKYCLGLVLLATGLVSCSKNSPDTVDNNHVYIDVQGTSVFSPGRYYLKDLVQVSVNADSSISGKLYVSGDDVYYPTVGGYLKNGVQVDLPGARLITCVFVKNGDIYAAGTRQPYGASYWKNGQLVKLEPDSSNYAGYPQKILVSGNDVYVGGEVVMNAVPNQVAYWKNLEMHIIEEGTFSDMALSGSDVHIVGSIPGDQSQTLGVHWKNVVRQIFTGFNGSRPNFMTSVYVNNGNIYMTGGMGCALYWKNDQPVTEINTSIYPVGVLLHNNKIQVVTNFVVNRSTGPESIVLLWDRPQPDSIAGGNALGICSGN